MSYRALDQRGLDWLRHMSGYMWWPHSWCLHCSVFCWVPVQTRLSFELGICIAKSLPRCQHKQVYWLQCSLEIVWQLQDVSVIFGEGTGVECPILIKVLIITINGIMFGMNNSPISLLEIGLIRNEPTIKRLLSWAVRFETASVWMANSC